MKRLTIIDHFDSFTYNLVCAFERLGMTVQVLRTNATMHEVLRTHPDGIVLSPGPGHPIDVRLFGEAIARFRGHIPILGVCLGMQAIALSLGAQVERNWRQMHGKTSPVHHAGEGIFKGIPSPFAVCRYHSLVASRESAFAVTAETDEHEVMAIASLEFPTMIGVQFHPESLFTEHGEMILSNFTHI
ncbi:MAG: aminodeoxychorismate/anthranilate synthase component II [Patescibacteria group bacterium]